ncbi:MAG: hypothetical protein A3G91_00450 [Omnitrophica WOR_2 bacterium RIFCSPLOWO2_12_FULL_50_9]|nr:MAG: hypothetical protein A3G91_00450 [Omnitrophica WOR_2 bacterium RIFCSPLOWO2_12_FULL_50_9]
MRPFPRQFGSFQIILFLFFLGLLAYGQTLSYPFVHDDVVFIQENPHIADLNLKRIFLGTGAAGQPAPVINVYYRPLVDLAYKLQYRLFHLNPAGYHFFNILFHVANSFLVYIILVGSLGADKKGVAFGTALFFLLHPVQTEAVACIAGMSNLLFAFFGLLSLSLYLRWRCRKERPAYVLSLSAFFLSLWAKEQAVIFPFLILLIEAFLATGDKDYVSRRILRLSGFFAVLIGYFILRHAFLGQGGIPLIPFNGELLLRILSIPRTLLMYLGIIFVPRHLHYYRSTDILTPDTISFLVMPAVALAVFRIIRWTPPAHKRILLLGCGWFFVSLLPVLNIVPLINEYSLILTAEHFLYVPLIGVLLFVLGLGHYWLGRREGGPPTARPASGRSHGLAQGGRPAVFAASALGLIGLIFLMLTVQQNSYWSGEVSLFERTVRFEKNFGRAHILLARAYYFNGEYPKAIDAYQKALAIMQGYVPKAGVEGAKTVYLGFIKGIHFDLANCLEAAGDGEGALNEYIKALRLDPRDAILHNNTGILYLRLNNSKEAIRHFEEAVSLDKNNLTALNNLAACYLETGRRKEAEGLLKEILVRDPRSAFAREHLKKNSVPP